MTGRHVAILALVAASCGLAVPLWFTLGNLPEVQRLARERPPTTAFIERFRAEQRKTGKSDRVEWRWVPFDSISPNLKRATITSEDVGFFSHHGFEVDEMKEALSQALRERAVPRGASTITQQLAKNLWLSPSRDPLRKLREAMLTARLEKTLTKRRILEIYLNVVQFGAGIYGAEAASRHYFAKPAYDLTEHESALLATGLPRPGTWNPASTSRSYQRQVVRLETRAARATFLWARLHERPPITDSLGLDTGFTAFLRSDTLFKTYTLFDTAGEDSTARP
jgi:monofunctional glycosyltransferase